MLALYFCAITPNIYRAVVTPAMLKSCAWIKNMYPGYLEHPAIYEWLIALVGLLAISAAVVKLNAGGWVRSFLDRQPSLSGQLGFASALGAALLVMSSTVIIGIGVISQILGSGRNLGFFQHETPLILSAILFILSFSLLRLQWRNERERRAIHDQSPLFFSASISLLTSLICYLLQSALFRLIMAGGSGTDILGYISIHVTPSAVATCFTASLAASGFMSGLVLSILSFDPSPERRGERKREIAAFLVIFAAAGLSIGIFSQKYLNGRLHFFTGFDRVISVNEGRGDARKAIVYSDGASQQFDMTLERTLFTEENMDALRRYVSIYGPAARYSDDALARLTDQRILDWDVPGALEMQQKKVETRHDSVLDIMISLAVLMNGRADSSMNRFVEYYTNPKLFCFPGSASYARAAALLQHYGYADRAAQFLGEARKKNIDDSNTQYYLKAREEAYDSTSDLSGTVLHDGRPLQGVKVRLFPLRYSYVTSDRMAGDIERRLSAEKRHGLMKRNFFQQATFSNYLILRDIYAVTVTDASGRFSFSNLPPDEYRVAILLEGPSASLRPEGSPGSARITARGSHLTLSAIELK
jgi:hypothetical protein